MINLSDGKYKIENNNGILKFYRNGVEWDRSDLIGDGLVLALVQKIEDIESKQESDVKIVK